MQYMYWEQDNIESYLTLIIHVYGLVVHAMFLNKEHNVF